MSFGYLITLFAFAVTTTYLGLKWKALSTNPDDYVKKEGAAKFARSGTLVATVFAAAIFSSVSLVQSFVAAGGIIDKTHIAAMILMAAMYVLGCKAIDEAQDNWEKIKID